ncbi:MAG: chloride channel protein [Kaiparowitsia implicata GSE-PSE-MK54-09C]|jgi:CIC family chloride channel protein|nr:chloride channel protein [Kaiparowitsia implicata GSE-PSE-MK54-09C]
MWSFLKFRPLRDLLTHPRRYAVMEACAIGLISGLAAVLLKQGVGLVGGWRIQTTYAAPGWLVLPLIGLAGGLMAGFLVERLAPEAAGSGIPQVKAVLANVPLVLNLRVALVKLLSVILTMGSGMNLGRQGPTVQIGAALATQLSQWIPTSPAHRRQLIAAGAAAGLAAGFNAPIAGVLFVVEEFLHDFSGITLGTAILASFVGAVVSRLLGGQGLSLDSAITSFDTSFSLQDVPFFLVLGLLAGLAGTLFSKGIFAALRLYRQLPQLGLPGKMGLAGLVSGLVGLALPLEFRDNTGLQMVLSTGDATWQLTLLAFAAKFVLTLVAYGSGAPGGIFAPSLILGSALGYLVGTSAHGLETLVGIPLGIPVGISSNSTYALAGMGAFFSAVTRGPITAIVIVFEITANFNLVLPLMIGSVIAYLLALRLAGKSIYTDLLAWNGIEIDDAPDGGQPWRQLTAATLMQRRVETLSSSMSVSEVTQAFSRSHHRGFPVVDAGKLVGIVTQSDLADNSRRPPEVEQAKLMHIMTPRPVTVSPTDPLTHVLYLLNRFKLSRLPVTDGQRLVGIITRADIIRAESDQLSAEGWEFGPQPEPSYLVYQTRSPATGRGRLLLPISNPASAPLLLKLAAAIAQDHHYELELLQVIPVPRNSSPAETPVRTTQSRRLLRQLEHLGEVWQIPIHTQIRAAHDVAQAILETVTERHVDLVLMGWKGNTGTPGRVFGNVVDTLIRQAPCDVMLVRLGESPQFSRWLVPIAGGPNMQQALKLLPSLIQIGQQPEVRICQVILPNSPTLITQPLQDAAAQLKRHVDCPVVARPIWGESVADTILQLAERKPYDVIVLGASREGLLTQVMQGNIPEAIARHSRSTVILVRGALSP